MKRLNEASVDIVISDFVLPRIHGLTLVREIRSRWPAIAVIIMSAYLGQEAGTVILEREAEYVAKPLQLSHPAVKVYGVLIREADESLLRFERSRRPHPTRAAAISGIAHSTKEVSWMFVNILLPTIWLVSLPRIPCT